MSDKVIFHLDLDAFFVSVERILNPDLINKPVIVGGDPKGRGVVAACSYEARKFGVHSAMPAGKAFKLCPNAVFLHGHFDEYVNYSKSVRYILESYAPLIEQTSIDEFFMDFTGCERIYGHPYILASRIQVEIEKELRLPTSIGIASNKFIAKIASDYAKPRGITFVIPGSEAEFLAPLPVEAMIGVGDYLKKELNSRGIYRIGEIANSSPEYLQLSFGKIGQILYDHANGKGSEYLNSEIKRKNISRETTFDTDITDKNKLLSILIELNADVCNTLRQRNWSARTISIKIRYNDFVTLTRAKTLSEPVSEDNIIYETAKELFINNYKRRVGVRLIGIHLTNFSENFEQGILFESIAYKRKKAFKTIDKLRSKYGLEIIKYGA